MSFLDSSTMWFSNGGSTSSLFNSNIAGTTTLGGTTTTGVACCFNEKKLDPKRVSTVASVAATSTTTLVMQSQTKLPLAYSAKAQEIGWTAEMTDAVNIIRDTEEWFDSLSEEQQLELLAKLDEKESTFQAIKEQEKSNIKHI